MSLWLEQLYASEKAGWESLSPKSDIINWQEDGKVEIFFLGVLSTGDARPRRICLDFPG